MKEVLKLNIEDVAGNIKKIRKIKSLTQEFLAAKLDISQNAYSKIELGHSKLTVERMYQIADILNVDVIQLLSPIPNNFSDKFYASV
ncbi:possible transcriptional regulator [Pedobacter sp. BAL39]|uniref:helix-turn-helix domain-containing protein n=1 Tax=Pedobacter sp. BAL39 TaxID=391596 RepID=UPI00015592CC|nr:helix-turn-helix transcriptional regulator [Pedobacter sp. BAL39]EDM37496.1 possible transcriptional regulator [Pedobacter sp. BAL39]